MIAIVFKPFAFSPAVRLTSFITCTPQTPQSSSVPQKSEEVTVSKTAAEDKPSLQEKPAAKTPEPFPPSALAENSESKKKPAGAVSLFGGIDVFENKAKSPLNENDNDDSFSKDSPPPNVKTEEKKEEKVKTKAVSLFEDEEEDESDWNDPIFTPSKPASRITLKVCMLDSQWYIVKN